MRELAQLSYSPSTPLYRLKTTLFLCDCNITFSKTKGQRLNTVSRAIKHQCFNTSSQATDTTC